jgi:hypothetical protein
MPDRDHPAEHVAIGAAGGRELASRAHRIMARKIHQLRDREQAGHQDEDVDAVPQLQEAEHEAWCSGGVIHADRSGQDAEGAHGEPFQGRCVTERRDRG